MERRTVLRLLGGAALGVAGGGLAVLAVRPEADTPGHPDIHDGPPSRARGRPTGAPRDASAPGGQGGRQAEAPPTEPLPPPVEDGETAGPDEPPEGPAETAEMAAASLICREAWNAAPPTRPHDGHTISRLTVHHTAVSAAGWDRDRIRRYQSQHQDRGMADLAYHVLVSPAGDLYEGRPFSTAGETFTAYDPAGHLHVVVEGNFDEESPTEAQLRSVAALLAWGAETFSADPATIAGHQRYAVTACPGTNLQRSIASGWLRTEVERLLDAGGVELRRIC
jgi:hypothetical protein